MTPLYIVRYGSASERHTNLEFNLNQEMHDNPRVRRAIQTYLERASENSYRRLKVALAKEGYQLTETRGAIQKPEPPSHASGEELRDSFMAEQHRLEHSGDGDCDRHPLG